MYSRVRTSMKNIFLYFFMLVLTLEYILDQNVFYALNTFWMHLLCSGHCHRSTSLFSVSNPALEGSLKGHCPA